MKLLYSVTFAACALLAPERKMKLEDRPAAVRA
jgi:hypothetical protein